MRRLLTGKVRIMLVASGLTTVAAATLMVAGVTFGLYSGKPPAETNSMTSGTLTLSSTVTGACTITNMAPGDSPAACTLGLSYAGSLWPTWPSMFLSRPKRAAEGRPFTTQVGATV